MSDRRGMTYALKAVAKRLGDPLFWALSKAELHRFLRQHPSGGSKDILPITKSYGGWGWYKRLSAFQVDSEFQRLADWAAAERPATVVEIGTASGATLLLWSRVAQRRVISIDLPGGIHGGGYSAPKMRLFREFVFDRPGVRMDLLHADSQNAATRSRVEQMLGTDRVDLLFIDGDHRLAGVTRDFELWKDLVRPGGRIVFHDVVPHHTQPSCQVDVLWSDIKTRYPGQTTEIVESPVQGWAGIGILTV